MAECRKLRPGGLHAGRQGLTYNEGISAQSAGSSGICMVLVTIPPGGRGKAHRHSHHETAIYLLEGETVMLWGERLEHRMEVSAGEMLYIPADMPHLPMNLSDRPAVAVIARTDPNEQESIVLMPDLEALVPETPSRPAGGAAGPTARR